VTVVTPLEQLSQEPLDPHDEQPEQLEHELQGDAQPQTGRNVTWRSSVTGRPQVVQPPVPQLEQVEQLEQAGAQDEHDEQAGAYEAQVEQPVPHDEQPEDAKAIGA
jgi:hypothetical protein